MDLFFAPPYHQDLLTMRRFYSPDIAPLNATLTLEPEQSHHIATVLRLTPGTAILLFDGQGTEIQATILAVRKKEVSVQVTSQEFTPPPAPSIHLYLGLLKGKKMDFLVQKMTELGIDHLHPFTSDFNATPSPSSKRLERWRKIAMEACKQCGRTRLMTIAQPASLPDSIQAQSPNNALVFWEDEPRQTINTVTDLATRPNIHCFIGPEGGFSPGEISTIKQANIPTLSLGDLTLRAETAAICATTLLLFQSGRLTPNLA